MTEENGMSGGKSAVQESLEKNRIDLERFGSFIALRRREKRLTQKQLAERLFVSNKAVSKWENALSLPDIGLLEPLAEALDVTVSELLHGEKQEDRELTGEEIRKWLADRDAALKRNSAMQREKRKRNVICYVAGFLLTAVEMVLYYLFRQELGVNELDMFVVMPLMEGMPLFFGLWAFVLMPERLPAYYDLLDVDYYAYAGLRMHITGVRFHNRNWPYILKALRGFCFLTPVCWPVLYVLLRLTLLKSGWYMAILPVMLTVLLGGLFVPIYVAAKKYD